MPRSFRNRPRLSTVDAEDNFSPCGWPGCAESGLYRAPRSPRDLKDFHWFCLAHVRQYNASWNYYDGMNEREVEEDRRRDTVWHRPSWPLAGKGSPEDQLRDAFGVFGGGGRSNGSGTGGSTDNGNGNGRHHAPSDSPEYEAMLVLALEPPLTEARVKARYKKLVKVHHPDINGGAKEAEERFKEIQRAYQTIMERLSS